MKNFLNYLIMLALVLFVAYVNTSAQNIQLTKEGNTVFVNGYNSGKLIFTEPSSGEKLPNDKLQQSREINPFGITSFNWLLKFTAPGKVFKDVSFANTQVGYIVTELGGVYKTTDGGNNWTIKMNIGFPYYWYGVHALSPDTVVIAGFDNQGAISSGVVRWSFNGGDTWTPDIILRIASGVGWLDRVHFFNQNMGIVFAGLSGAIHYTTTGGKDSTSWNYIQVNSDLAWFAGNYDFQNTGNIYATGIHLAKSTNYGVNWVSGPSADNVFDGGIDFLDNNNLYGWTGGGQISSPVSGWMHRTTDGGQSWGNRLFDFPYPIRAVKFYDTNLGLALGGNLYQEAGGIYSTTNGGVNWNLDISTSAEMFSVETKMVSADSADIWCVGSTGGGTGFTGKLYKTRAAIVTGIENTGSALPKSFALYQNYPNPFNPETKIKFSLPFVGQRHAFDLQIIIYDILGREVTSLFSGNLSPGTYEINWNAFSYPSGIYFYKLTTNDFTETKKMILIK